MGLDISAYSHMVKSSINPTTEEETEEAWERGAQCAFWYHGFDRSGRGLVQDAWYEPTDQTKSHGFRAGSYSGYNHWRKDLAEHVGLELQPDGPNDYWGKPDTGQPFYELINFADNEGTIGPEAAADLLADFRAHEKSYVAAHSTGPMGEYDVERYHHWILAFELASQGGMVVFH